MELGEKLKKARLEAGLSQRQLGGEVITRNMLSLIENGSAKPSMKTLQYLAGRLGKSVSWFLEEEGAVSPNASLMASARRLYDGGEYSQAALVLEGYQGPDGVFDRERDLLWVLCHLALARKALEEGREPYARTLLDKSDIPLPYCAEDLGRQRLLLRGRLRGEGVSPSLPSLDEELILRGKEALEGGDLLRAGQLLDAAEDQRDMHWLLLRGQVFLAAGDWKAAAEKLHLCEADFPRQTAGMLELCYKELGDYKKAYEYACRQR